MAATTPKDAFVPHEVLAPVPSGVMIDELWPHPLLLVGVLVVDTYVPELVLWLLKQAGETQ